MFRFHPATIAYKKGNFVLITPFIFEKVWLIFYSPLTPKKIIKFFHHIITNSITSRINITPAMVTTASPIEIGFRMK
jgi:hypothetical protein